MPSFRPPLLDRLTDEPLGSSGYGFTETDLKESVRRDLGWLLNAVRNVDLDVRAYPYVADSILNYGVPDLVGHHMADLRISGLRESLYEAIRRFEPRLRLSNARDAIHIHEMAPDAAPVFPGAPGGGRRGAILEGFQIEIKGRLVVEPVELFVSVDLLGDVSLDYGRSAG